MKTQIKTETDRLAETEETDSQRQTDIDRHTETDGQGQTETEHKQRQKQCGVDRAISYRYEPQGGCKHRSGTS